MKSKRFQIIKKQNRQLTDSDLNMFSSISSINHQTEKIVTEGSFISERSIIFDHNTNTNHKYIPSKTFSKLHDDEDEEQINTNVPVPISSNSSLNNTLINNNNNNSIINCSLSINPSNENNYQFNYTKINCIKNIFGTLEIVDDLDEYKNKNIVNKKYVIEILKNKIEKYKNIYLDNDKIISKNIERLYNSIGCSYEDSDDSENEEKLMKKIDTNKYNEFIHKRNLKVYHKVLLGFIKNSRTQSLINYMKNKYYNYSLKLRSLIGLNLYYNIQKKSYSFLSKKCFRLLKINCFIQKIIKFYFIILIKKIKYKYISLSYIDYLKESYLKCLIIVYKFPSNKLNCMKTVFSIYSKQYTNFSIVKSSFYKWKNNNILSNRLLCKFYYNVFLQKAKKSNYALKKLSNSYKYRIYLIKILKYYYGIKRKVFQKRIANMIRIKFLNINYAPSSNKFIKLFILKIKCIKFRNYILEKHKIINIIYFIHKCLLSNYMNSKRKYSNLNNQYLQLNEKIKKIKDSIYNTNEDMKKLINQININEQECKNLRIENDKLIDEINQEKVSFQKDFQVNINKINDLQLYLKEINNKKDESNNNKISNNNKYYKTSYQSGSSNKAIKGHNLLSKYKITKNFRDEKSINNYDDEEQNNESFEQDGKNKKCKKQSDDLDEIAKKCSKVLKNSKLNK